LARIVYHNFIVINMLEKLLIIFEKGIIMLGIQDVFFILRRDNL